MPQGDEVGISSIAIGTVGSLNESRNYSEGSAEEAHLLTSNTALVVPTEPDLVRPLANSNPEGSSAGQVNFQQTGTLLTSNVPYVDPSQQNDVQNQVPGDITLQSASINGELQKSVNILTPHQPHLDQSSFQIASLSEPNYQDNKQTNCGKRDGSSPYASLSPANLCDTDFYATNSPLTSGL